MQKSICNMTEKVGSSGSSSKDLSEIPTEVSLRLFKEGAIFVFLDVPIGTEIGIDMQSWNTGEKFRGIKMIPPGLHFVYFSAVSKDHQNTAPRTGFFHVFKKGELLVKKYDPRMEDISTDDVPQDMVDTMMGRLEEMDSFLGPYPYSLWRKWISLTNKVSLPVLKKLSPPSGRILSVPELTLDKDQSIPSTIGRKLTKLEMAEEALPRMSENVESKIRYTEIPSENYPVGASPQEITKYLLDKTWKLQRVFQTMGSPQEYLSEMQFAFVNFLVGQNYESFEHWKSLIHLLCYSDNAIANHSSLYSDFISDVYFQMKEVPEDFFADIVTSNNFLFNCLQRLISNVNEHTAIETKLKNKVQRFSSFLTSKFGWEFDETDDDAPTIVDEADAIIANEKSSQMEIE